MVGLNPKEVSILYVEYAERRTNHRILFRFGLLYEYSNLECECIYAIYRVTQAEYDIHICMAASQEYVNPYSTRRVSIDRLSGVGASAGVCLLPRG